MPIEIKDSEHIIIKDWSPIDEFIHMIYYDADDKRYNIYLSLDHARLIISHLQKQIGDEAD